MDAEFREYLLSYGTMGDFGRFRPTTPLVFRRGDRAVIRSWRGLEMGEVLCEATPGHAEFLPNTTLGKLLRLATTEDERKLVETQSRGAQLLDAANQLIAQLDLPLTLLDAEVLLDGKLGVLHHLAWAEFDERELVSRLASSSNLQVTLHSLAVPAAEEEHGCGRPDCGKSEGGGCGTCGSGGGCSTCHTGAPADLQSYFAGLREKMATDSRTSLL